MNQHDLAPDVLAAIRQEIADMQQTIAGEPAGRGLVPLRIKCTMTSCRHGRHCLDHLRPAYRGEQRPSPGACRDCGVVVASAAGSLGQSPDDAGLIATCRLQQSELIRAHYWQVPIDQWAFNQALRAGSRELRDRVAAQVSRAMDPTNIYSGRGAAYAGNMVAYAQHATATCCRNCAAYWHGTPRDKVTPLSEAQLAHVIKAAQAFIAIRLPDLPLEPADAVPSIRRSLLFAGGDKERYDDHAFSALADGIDPAGLLVPLSSSIQVSAVRRGLIVERHLDPAV
ncbi:DUF4186 family protein [Nocardioides flavescens]|uniref:DUF4186 family protein n=1 Tax=Nocardioides flavescens TaxID=2691959 RepID=A0A6L7EM72_9ACTN|nr:DUF4186 family protein [Nocardioides flavescens]MXG88427.1 DUF4186 family protein [Nocardioides flavescens]